MDHHHLANIDQSRTDWVLKVRVTRVWPTFSPSGDNLRHNLILLDCQHNHIHAVVPSRLWFLYDKLIIEGGLIRVENFIVTHASDFYRPVNFPLIITFNKLTVVHDVPYDDSMILMHKFKFTPFEYILREANGCDLDHRAIYSTDVIGVMDNLQPEHPTNSIPGVNRMLCFSISDGRSSLDVCLRDPLNFDVDALYENQIDLPAIVILASTKLMFDNGGCTITNLDSTKVYVNLGHQEVFMIRQRLTDITFFT